MQQDPKPTPPPEPGPDDCCHSGCTWCVLDLYYEELEKYRKQLAEWEARQAAAAAAPSTTKPARRRTPKH